jgi:hypothetical protein
LTDLVLEISTQSAYDSRLIFGFFVMNLATTSYEWLHFDHISVIIISGGDLGSTWVTKLAVHVEDVIQPRKKEWQNE